MKNIVLVDADSLCYLGSKEDTLPQILEKVDNKLHSIIEETQANFYCLFISKGKYFRHDFKEKVEDKGSYKSNRLYKGSEYSKTVKEYLVAKYNAVYTPRVEADDLIAYWMKNPIAYGEFVNPHSDRINMLFDTSNAALKLAAETSEDCNVTLASIDKDLLESIPGKHLNYNKKTGPETWEMVWITTSKLQANNFKLKQLIVGDTSDGVAGIPRKGEKYWEGMISESKNNLFYILKEYITYYGQSQGIYEFQKNYRILHLLDEKEDWLREIGFIPELPSFTEVKREEEIQVKF